MESSKSLTNDRGVDLFITIPSVVIVLGFALAIFLKKEAMNKFLTDTFWFMSYNFGWMFLVFFVITSIMCIWLVFGKYAHRRFGDEKPELSDFTFYAMLFTFGSSASIIYWVFIEFFFYLEGPPFNAEPFSLEALRWGSTYGTYHWGAVPFSSYALLGVAFAYFIHVKKQNTSRVSAACASVIGEKNANGMLGKIIDGFFLVTVVISSAGYSLGVSVPIVATFAERTFGVANTLGLKIWIMVAVTVCCGITIYTGLNKGMRFISNARLIMFFGVLVYVLIVGPTAFMINNTIESIGWQAQHIIQMSLQTDAIGGSGWPQSWTVFYGFFFVAAVVSGGLYIAKLCKGRTVRESVIASVIASAAGCAIFFWVMGNYSIYTYLGDPETFKAMMAQDPYNAIAYVIETLPFGKVVMAVLLVYAFISTWTFIQTAIYSMAMVAQPNLPDNEEPSKFGRIAWCVITGVLALAFLYIGGLQTVKNSMVWAGFPALALSILIIISTFKDMKKTWSEPENKESTKLIA